MLPGQGVTGTRRYLDKVSKYVSKFMVTKALPGVTWPWFYPDNGQGVTQTVLSGRYYLDKNSCYLDKVLSGQGVTRTKCYLDNNRCYLD